MANCVQCGRQLPALTFGKKLCQWCLQHEAAQRGEDSPIQRVEPAPWMRRQSNSMAVTQAIFGINVAVFVAMTLAGVSITEPTFAQLVHWGANYGPLTIRRPMVAVIELRVRAHRHHPHRVQYVVSVGSGQTSRVGLRSLDVWCGLPDHRRSG